MTAPAADHPAKASQPGATMNAIVHEQYGSAEVMHPAVVPVPTISANEVLIRVHAAGVDRSVWHILTGRPLVARLMFGLRAPKKGIRGADVAGTVVAIGAAVTTHAVGDEVFGVADGSYAEFAKARANTVVAKPAALSFAQAASLPISGCAAVRAIEAADVKPGQTVLVLGASGGVGSFLVHLAVAAGAEVTAVCSAAKADFVRSLGATTVLDYATQDATDGSVQYDAILDGGGNASLKKLRGALTKNGVVAIIGGEGSGSALLGGSGRAMIAGLVSLFVPQRLVGIMSSENEEYLSKLAALAQSRALVPHIDREYSLTEVPDAIRALESGRIRGKVAIVVGRSD